MPPLRKWPLKKLSLVLQNDHPSVAESRRSVRRRVREEEEEEAAMAPPKQEDMARFKGGEEGMEGLLRMGMAALVDGSVVEM